MAAGGAPTHSQLQSVMFSFNYSSKKTRNSNLNLSSPLNLIRFDANKVHLSADAIDPKTYQSDRCVYYIKYTFTIFGPQKSSDVKAPDQ